MARREAEFDEPAVDEPATINPGYVGPQACAACHAERVAEFQKTKHFRTSRLPDAAEMPPGFAPRHATYATRDPALRFEMTHADGDFIQTAIRRTPAGEQRTSKRIGLVYGAGGCDELYHYWQDDGLYELPMGWLHPLNRWANPPGFPEGTANFSRETGPRCLECHNTWFEHLAGTVNRYTRDNWILGVTCERCHGPGREHVAYHRAHPEADVAQAVVRPARLTQDRQLDLCAQCHSNATKGRGPAFSYRAGAALEAHFRTDVGNRPEDDHTANQVRSLRQSKCFQEDATLTCTTCHDPHRPQGPTSSGGQSCRKCHQPADCSERERLSAAVRDDCVGCHMPPHFAMNVNFYTGDDDYVPLIRRHEHRIGVHPAARDEVLLAWYRTQSDAHSREEAARLTKSLVEHWLAEAESYRRAYRFKAAIGALRETLRLDPAPATRDRLRANVAIQTRLDADWLTAIQQISENKNSAAIETLNKILAVKPNWAKVHGTLGTLSAQAGQMQQSFEHLQAAAKFDPDDAYGDAALGWLAYLQDRHEDAVEFYRRADEIEPFNARINYHRGLALEKLGRLPEAVECFRRVVRIDPNHAGGCHGLSRALRQQGELTEALRFALRAARLTRFQNHHVLFTLTEVYTNSGRFADADRTAAQVLDAALISDPQSVPLIRRHLEKLQRRTRGP